jgi:hypothetical protein
MTDNDHAKPDKRFALTRWLHAVRDDQGLDFHTKGILLLLATRFPNIAVSQQRLARDANVHVGTVNKYLAKARASGWIERTYAGGNPGDPDRYKLIEREAKHSVSANARVVTKRSTGTNAKHSFSANERVQDALRQEPASRTPRTLTRPDPAGQETTLFYKFWLSADAGCVVTSFTVARDSDSRGEITVPGSLKLDGSVAYELDQYRWWEPTFSHVEGVGNFEACRGVLADIWRKHDMLPGCKSCRKPGNFWYGEGDRDNGRCMDCMEKQRYDQYDLMRG